jgi:hypothetical protein
MLKSIWLIHDRNTQVFTSDARLLYAGVNKKNRYGGWRLYNQLLTVDHMNDKSTLIACQYSMCGAPHAAVGTFIFNRIQAFDGLF